MFMKTSTTCSLTLGEHDDVTISNMTSMMMSLAMLPLFIPLTHLHAFLSHSHTLSSLPPPLPPPPTLLSSPPPILTPSHCLSHPPLHTPSYHHAHTPPPITMHTPSPPPSSHYLISPCTHPPLLSLHTP